MAAANEYPAKFAQLYMDGCERPKQRCAREIATFQERYRFNTFLALVDRDALAPQLQTVYEDCK